jgi:hypothetical protein
MTIIAVKKKSLFFLALFFWIDNLIYLEIFDFLLKNKRWYLIILCTKNEINVAGMEKNGVSFPLCKKYIFFQVAKRIERKKDTIAILHERTKK